MPFYTEEGIQIPAVTTDQMREVDRVAVEVFKLDILQMMENAGRNLAALVINSLGSEDGPVLVLAGPGGNGGGGICCVRHLRNHGIDVSLVLTKQPTELGRAATAQYHILYRSGFRALPAESVEHSLRTSKIVVDAIIGYSLQGAPRGKTAELISLASEHAPRMISLDVPSGLDSTSGEAVGVVLSPEITLTLALPKTGLSGISGALYLADIGIPPEVYSEIGVHFEPFFAGRYSISLEFRKRSD